MKKSALPVAQTVMLIRKPAVEVFEAFIDPAITTKFWFSKSSDKLEKGKQVKWIWEMYNHSVEVFVCSIIPEDKIVLEWGNYQEQTTVEWGFRKVDASKTFVQITNRGFTGSPEELLSKTNDATEGFTLVLAGLKAWLEHGIQLNLVRDRFPKELRSG